jgi:GTPase SAR1 family protein
MGNVCLGKDPMKRADEQITHQQQQSAIEMGKEIKLLLLGAGESGKSTLFKQMKIIHHNGYSQDECMVYKDIIRSNILQSMKALIAATHKFNIAIDDPENRARASKVNEFDQNALLNISKIYTPQLGQELEALWKDKGIQAVYQLRSNFQLLDSTEYFFSHISRISVQDYVPTEQDVLRCRVKTTGIVETEFDFAGFKFRLFDVGGQRNERKKWIHCFDNVTAVIFVTSLSEYDQKCYEDDSTLRMKESLVLFDEICNSRYFQDTPIMLFFNKLDLFREKIKKIDLSTCFEDYTDGCDYDKALKFIQNAFLSLNREEGKTIYCHFTCATDTDNIKVRRQLLCFANILQL